MRIEVDQLKCRTVGICVMTCPDVFRFQVGSKRAAVDLEEIPTHLKDKCREAARKCPNKAIIIKE